MKKAVVLLAEGFEEVEAVTPVDLLRRAGIEVVIAGIGSASVTGARGITISADSAIDTVKPEFDAVIIPGGGGGAENIAKSAAASNLIRKIWKEGGLVAAICASPAVVLAPLGILSGKKAVCYPGLEGKLTGAIHTDASVVRDGTVITGKGPGTAFDFALAIIEYLNGKKEADQVRNATKYGI